MKKKKKKNPLDLELTPSVIVLVKKERAGDRC